MAALIALLFLSASAAAASQHVTLPSQCSCGYRDPDTNLLYTDSIIAYFNETKSLDNDTWKVLDYAYHNQKGWNTIFRQGASPSNLEIIDGAEMFPSLNMYLDGMRFNHLSNGAEIRTMRQDILYGTFRSSMKSAKPWVGGSAMSMYLSFNESQSLELDLLNMNDAREAKVMQLINGEYPDDTLATNYSMIEAGDPPSLPQMDPWDFMEVGFDWNKNNVSFWIGENRTRSVTKNDRTIPTVPQPLFFSHWSTGDANYMEGPPVNQSVANVEYIRAFFNSSLMSASDHVTYDQKCAASTACSINDITLRGSSEYSAAALIKWKRPVANSRIRKIAGFIAAAFSVFGVASLVNAFVRRTPWHKLRRLGNKGKSTAEFRQSFGPPPQPYRGNDAPRSGTMTPAPSYSRPGTSTPLPGYESRIHSPWQSVHSLHSPGGSAPNSRRPSVANFNRMKASGLNVDEKVAEEDETVEPSEQSSRDQNEDDISPTSPVRQDNGLSFSSRKDKSSSRVLVDSRGVEGTVPAQPEVYHEKSALQIMKNQAVPDAMTGGATEDPAHQQQIKKPEQTQRIDYLAGLVAISCIMVTLRHFSLTFWPYVTEGQGLVKHFGADQILSYILGPYVLTPLWIGPFFVTSCRFLAQRYLRTGSLKDIGNKMLLRAPRMLIPCFIFATLEYFLISLGLTARLEWLPSVSYSTWPYVQPQGNFGVFLDELVELSYIIPNAAPEIINHYCVGVLWTIPVQLQFSFVTLLAAVLIKDVKRPWKRFAFYTITILAGWYATSWSACHWLGLLLADLDLTYNWIKWTQARWWALYPMLFLATAMVVLSPLALLFNSSVYNWSFMAYENAIHPDTVTGRPILGMVSTIWAAYPNYNNPSLVVLTFSVGLQMIVELSTWVQKALSTSVVTFFHPHIMTIYLLHGFVFWSLGAYIAVALSSTSVPYWGTLLIVAVCCYSVILLVAMIITPLIEFATKGTTKNIWRWATEVPVPHRPTMAPFNKELVLGRQVDESKEQGSA